MTSTLGSRKLLDFLAFIPLVGITLLLGLQDAASAGKHNRVVDIGDKPPAWSDLPAASGEVLSLSSLDDKTTVAIVFISQDCPIAKRYEQRLKKLTEDFSAEPFALIAVNVNKGETLEQMKAYAAEQAFNFKYLRDDSQKIAKQMGATCTPHAFVLNKQRAIVYMGAIDDHWQSSDGVEADYLRNAVKATLAGQAVEKAETRQVGCAIRWGR